MKYKEVPQVLAKITEDHKKWIDSVNNYMDELRGTVISFQHVRSGQPRPYADSVYETIICAHQPNIYTTGAPGLRYISRTVARELARTFVRNFSDTPAPYGAVLRELTPCPNPWGIPERGHDEEDLSACWRVVIVEPFTD